MVSTWLTVQIERLKYNTILDYVRAADNHRLENSISIVQCNYFTTFIALLVQ